MIPEKWDGGNTITTMQALRLSQITAWRKGLNNSAGNQEQSGGLPD